MRASKTPTYTPEQQSEIDGPLKMLAVSINWHQAMGRWQRRRYEGPMPMPWGRPH